MSLLVTGYFVGLVPLRLSLKAKSLSVGLGSLFLAFGTMKGLYLGFSFTGGGGPLFLSILGDFGTIFGTCLMDLGGNKGKP
jgi:hypothetical protein